MSVDDKPLERGTQRGERQEPAAADFVKLLDYLKATRGFDFSGYKLSSLIRRVRKRMQQIGIESYMDYIDFLEVHPDEFDPLFNTVLINVTSFFRDPQAWQALNEQILPRILENKAEDQPIRCWSAGCASGEEAYTLAMLLAEAVGDQQFRQRVKIYATDVDEEALTQARQGSYPAAAVESLPEGFQTKYFEPMAERVVFRPDLRRSLIFGRHDLVQDAAISRLDLLVCRNTLMYFNSEMQAKILARFHFALRPSGYLLLGKAETLLSHNTSFRPEDLKSRIFQRTSSASMRDRLLAMTPPTPSDTPPGGTARPVRAREAAFDNCPVAQLVVDRKGHLLLANERLRELFNLAPTDLGRLLQDLEISYRPVELRSHIETVSLSRTGVTVKGVEWRPVDGERRVLDVQVLPLIESGGALLGVSVSFLDVTVPHQLRRELERATQELETASEELQSSNEELETTNEELQSTIEELETTNEELQSANEELETMNEELQSTNEELRSMNDQLQMRSDELRHVNTHLHSILGSLRAAVVVLSPDLKVEIWSDKAHELWGLRGDEVQGQPFLSLDIGLPIQSLAKPIHDCLDSGPNGNAVILDGVNRRGRPIRCQVTCTRLGDGPGPADGVILLMEEASLSGAPARD
ncbi:MAG TPA: CheR family methyltransferase [Thermoanaerobaculia bacterium]|nr:CheR family methyltransferase [Thermoanaerobaculia bacterium]